MTAIASETNSSSTDEQLSPLPLLLTNSGLLKSGLI